MYYSQPIVFFDFETGGTEIAHPNISFGAAACRIPSEPDAEVIVVDRFEFLINFDERACDHEALLLAGYNREQWKEFAVGEHIAMGEFSKWLNRHATAEMISHKTNKKFNVAIGACFNQQFDVPRLRKAFERAQLRFLPMHFLVMDTLQLAAWCHFPHYSAPDKPGMAHPLPNIQLQQLADHYGIQRASKHTAAEDSITTAKVTHKLMIDMRSVVLR